MNIFKRIGTSLKNWNQKLEEAEKRRKAEKLRNEISTVKYYVEQESITCRCGGLAVPVFDANNKYHCVKCNSRFSNARHALESKLSRLDMFSIDAYTFDRAKVRERYAEAVKELKDEHRKK